MYLIDWLLIQTPDGATYLQVLIILGILLFLAKYFVLPELKEFKDIYNELHQGDDIDETDTNYFKRAE